MPYLDLVTLLIALGTLVYVGYDKIIMARSRSRAEQGNYAMRMAEAATQLVDSYERRLARLEKEVQSLREENIRLRAGLEQVKNGD